MRSDTPSAVAFDVAEWPTQSPSMIWTHAVQLLPVFDENGDLVMPAEYNAALSGALLHVTFSLNCYALPRRPASKHYVFIADMEHVGAFSVPHFDNTAYADLQIRIMPALQPGTTD